MITSNVVGDAAQHNNRKEALRPVSRGAFACSTVSLVSFLFRV
jgi:hypothetical protein